jgi:hypothetical protein
MLFKRVLPLFAPVILIVFLSACGGDSTSDGSATPTGSVTPGPSREPPTGEVTPFPTRGGSAGSIVPPLEGPARGPSVQQQEDFRLDPAWKLPTPEEAPVPDNTDDPVLNPPAQASCPAEWEILERPTEGWHVCYPANWAIDGQGYVGSANEARWYSVGIFDFTDETRVHQRAHVSVYVIPQFTRPFRYTIDCPQPFHVTFAGQPAVVCSSFPPTSPEARVISYHVFLNNLDYFVNIATYFEFDESSGQYTDKTSDDAFKGALDIVGTFEFIPIAPLPSP